MVAPANSLASSLQRLSPDIVVPSKSLSGYGLPLSMLLINEGMDV